MPTLLVIDDEPSILYFFRKAFSEPDVTLLTADTAAEGIATITRSRPDVVILVLPFLGATRGESRAKRGHRRAQLGNRLAHRLRRQVKVQHQACP